MRDVDPWSVDVIRDRNFFPSVNTRTHISETRYGLIVDRGPAIFRRMKSIIIVVTLLLSLITVVSAQAASLYDIPLKDIDGKPTSLAAYKGKVLLIVNVASKCGNTPQYAALEAMQKKYEAKGFTVLGFPCNDFAGQEPGTADQIKQFCSSTYSVTFPLFEKLHVKGPEQHPLYTALTGKDSPVPGPIDWNFAKFVIGRNGEIITRFKASVKPDAQEVTATVENAMLAKVAAPQAAK
jgi:glutathione peroxidase